MITATFHSWRGGDALSVGPRPFFRVIGASLYDDDQPVPLAIYAGGTWDIHNSGSYVRIVFDRNVSVALHTAEGAIRQLGELPKVTVVDGAMYAGPDVNQLLARFSEISRSWYYYEDEQHYTGLHFEVRHPEVG